MGCPGSTTARTISDFERSLVHWSRIPRTHYKSTNLVTITWRLIRTSKTSSWLSQWAGSLSRFSSQLGWLRSRYWWRRAISAIDVRSKKMRRWLFWLTMQSSWSWQRSATSEIMSRRFMDHHTQWFGSSDVGWTTFQWQRRRHKDHRKERTSARPNVIVGCLRHHVHCIGRSWQYGYVQLQSISFEWILSNVGWSSRRNAELQRLGSRWSIQSVRNLMQLWTSIQWTSSRILHLRRRRLLATNIESRPTTRLSSLFW